MVNVNQFGGAWLEVFADVFVVFQHTDLFKDAFSIFDVSKELVIVATGQRTQVIALLQNTQSLINVASSVCQVMDLIFCNISLFKGDPSGGADTCVLEVVFHGV